MTVQVLGALPPLWETLTELWVHGLCLAQPQPPQMLGASLSNPSSDSVSSHFSSKLCVCVYRFILAFKQKPLKSIHSFSMHFGDISEDPALRLNRQY